MLSDEARKGYEFFRQKVVAGGKLKITNQNEYTDRRAIYAEIGFETKRTDIVLSNEFLSDLGATSEYQAAVDLKARGVEFIQPPKKETWGEHAVVKVSEGNMVVIGTA
jgi:hypothetical protein